MILGKGCGGPSGSPSGLSNIELVNWSLARGVSIEKRARARTERPGRTRGLGPAHV